MTTYRGRRLTVGQKVITRHAAGDLCENGTVVEAREIPSYYDASVVDLWYAIRVGRRIVGTYHGDMLTPRNA